MKRSLHRILALLLTTATLASGCANAADGQKTKDSSGGGSKDAIKIGVFEPLTGDNAAGGQLEMKGIKLAHKLYPEVLGKKISLEEADNKSDRVEAANAAASLVNKKVSAVLGSWGSSLAIAGGPAFKNAKIPAIGTSCTNPQVTEGNPYYYRVCFIDPFQGTVMADYAYKTLGKKKAAIFREKNSDYSVGLAKFFQEQYQKLGGSIVATFDYQTKDQDFNAQLTNLKSAGAEVVFAPGNFTESALLVKQARQLGIQLPILGGDTWETPQLIEVGGKEVEGVVFSTFFDKDHPLTAETTKFVEAYKKEYPGEDIAAVSALAYDAYLMVYKAIEAAGSSDPSKIQEALGKVKDFQGAAGIVNFDDNRNAIKDAVLKTVKDGKFTYMDVVKIK
ncbi:Branched-chain amino acid ABC transporter, amino acid-binding protein [Clostridiaceae bacterium JG1575]|nr:Branched-chain amino acid ABC transporter, amino acid-binding protein [Clostridiaceae bacterium JG1575]